MTPDSFALELLDKLNAFCRLHDKYVLNEMMHVKEGEFIFDRGQRPKGVYFVCSGCIKVITSHEGEEALLTRLVGPNELIGYVSLIGGWDYSSSAMAICDSKVQFISKDLFIELLRSNVEFTNLMLQILCADVKLCQKTQLDFHKKNGKQRLAALLLSFDFACERFMGDNLFNKIPRKEIAGKIAVTPETVSRYLAEFKDRGFISEVEGSIKIKDKSALLRLSKVND